ncbi:MAG: lytic transglycosylase domain-containing protein [Bacteroidales bacterium]|nr:lytic transglycosylase domain-containing protein [Candidatus Colimorpha onthohippi]
MNRIAVIAIILSTIAIAGEVFIFATTKEQDDDVMRSAIENDYRVYPPVIPDKVDFAGERVPLEEYYVRESLDRELTAVMYLQSSTSLIMKRAGRFFPEIEKILRENGVPEDFKYLCVAESGLTNATSPAKAQGFWQFIESTGKKYGLHIDDDIDMRNDVTAATRAACQYLKQLYSEFGSWTSAAAAYNCGENGLHKRMEREQCDSYYDVRLNTETSRYVFRILAYKIILQDPIHYGFHIRKCDLYPPLPYRTIKIKGQNIDLYNIARANDCTYKILRAYNPWITTDKIVNRDNLQYTIKLPTVNGTKMKTLTKGSKDTSFIEKM